MIGKMVRIKDDVLMRQGLIDQAGKLYTITGKITDPNNEVFYSLKRQDNNTLLKRLYHHDTVVKMEED